MVQIPDAKLQDHPLCAQGCNSIRAISKIHLYIDTQCMKAGTVVIASSEHNHIVIPLPVVPMQIIFHHTISLRPLASRIILPYLLFDLFHHVNTQCMLYRRLNDEGKPTL